MQLLSKARRVFRPADRERLAETNLAFVANASPKRRQHGVHYDAGYRDVEPDREGESCQAAMGGEAAGERQEKRDQDHRQSHDGEADVRNQQRKIHRSDETLAVKMHVTVKRVIGDIGHEKQCRKNKRYEHSHPVPADLLCPDEAETNDKRDSGQTIQESVERRQKKQMGAGNVGGRMIVNEPTKEKARHGADSYNGDDYADWSPSVVICERRHLGQSIKHRSSCFATNERFRVRPLNRALAIALDRGMSGQTL